MISRIAIQNFKSIGDPGVDLELKPLTLLVGPNGGGKSSILEAIAVAGQQDISGKLVSFPSWHSIVHKSGTHSGSIEIYFGPTTSGEGPGFRARFDSQGHPVFERAEGAQGEREYPFRTSLFLIPSVRGNIPFPADTRREKPGEVSTNGDDLILLLSAVFGERKQSAIAAQIVKWATIFGLHGLKAGWRTNFQSGSDYLDSELKVALDLALSSSGAKQILTVITQLFWAPEGSLLMIEEPEISLHPQAQVDVLEMFGEAIREENKQIIATTHSHIMLQAVGYAVHKGWLDGKDIAVYHVEKKKTGTKAKLLPLRKQGYIKGWVPSFSKVERELLQEWAKTLPRK